MKFDRSLFKRPCNYTADVRIDGDLYHYHGETDPHTHEGETKDQTWCVKFVYFNRNYRFVYQRDGVLHSVVPKLEQEYEFDCLKLHGILHRDRVDKFHDEEFWTARTNNMAMYGPLACVFQFVQD